MQPFLSGPLEQSKKGYRVEQKYNNLWRSNCWRNDAWIGITKETTTEKSDRVLKAHSETTAVSWSRMRRRRSSSFEFSLIPRTTFLRVSRVARSDGPTAQTTWMSTYTQLEIDTPFAQMVVRSCRKAFHVTFNEDPSAKEHALRLIPINVV